MVFDKLIKKINTLINNIVMAFKSLGWKRDDSIVLFGSWFGERFADNSRFLYQYLSENMSKFNLTHVVWVSRSPSIVDTVNSLGYEAYLMDSKESINYHKIAKYHIICNAAASVYDYKADILCEYSWGAIKVNLWHGSLGFKNVGMSSNEYLVRKAKHRVLFSLKEHLHQLSLYRKFVELPGGWGDCYYVSNTPTTTRQLWCSSQLPIKNYIEAGTPRVSYLPKMTVEEKSILNYIRKFKKIIIYLPTFRVGESSFDFEEAGKSLQVYLKENNYLWVEKVHSANKLKPLVHGSNILNLPHDFDVNLLIPFVDMMVSDYSSALGEAMYYYKPIIFYVPDLNEYLTGERGVVENIEEIMCGSIVKSVNELKEAVDSVLRNEFKPDNKYLAVRERYYGSKKTISEIWEEILSRTSRKQ